MLQEVICEHTVYVFYLRPQYTIWENSFDNLSMLEDLFIKVVSSISDFLTSKEYSLAIVFREQFIIISNITPSKYLINIQSIPC